MEAPHGKYYYTTRWHPWAEQPQMDTYNEFGVDAKKVKKDTRGGGEREAGEWKQSAKTEVSG